MAQVVDIARVVSKIAGMLFLIMYLRSKEREKKLELLLLATFCVAV